MTPRIAPGGARALPLLLLGAVAIAFAPIFVRLSPVAPVATAFYRLLLALPVLWLWTALDQRSAVRRVVSPPRVPRSRREWLWIVLAGLCFAGDLAVWHWAIHYTSVANATLFANLAPVFVAGGAWLVFKERISAVFLLGLLCAVAGAAILIGISVGEGPQPVLGDALGVLTAVFYAGYLMAIKQARTLFSTAVTMLWSGIICCAVLAVIALLTEDQLLAGDLRGWAVLAGLALISHAGGQTLIAYALAHLPASFASVALLVQPVTAALLAWWLLDESLSGRQGAGALLALTGIYLAWRASAIKKIA